MANAEEVARKAVEACENLQAMIDISATTLHSLRISLQHNPSSQASQALREAETKLVKMFSRQLVSKASVAKLIDEPRLEQYPNTEQWLKVVGLPGKTVKDLVAENVTLDMLLKMTPGRIADTMKRSEAQQSEINTLNKALGKLKGWTESQLSGTPMALEKQSDLFWTESIMGSPSSSRSNRPAQIATSSRPTSSSSVSRSSTSSTSSEQHSTLNTGAFHGVYSGTMASQYSSSSGHSSSAMSSPHFRNGPSLSPITQHPSTPTMMKGKSRPNTPPPRRNIFIFPSSSSLQTGAGGINSQITKSVSHDATDTNNRIPILDSLIQSSVSVDEVSSIHSSKSDYYCYNNPPRMIPKHRIGHRFDTKNFKFGRCDLCKRPLTLTARVCRHCRYKCHKDCERNISQYSCGLTDELVREATKIFKDTSRSNIQGSPSLSSHNGSLQGNFRHPGGSTSIQDSSSASDYSSSPSSPQYSAYSAQASPANPPQMFTFPQVLATSRTQLSSVDADDYPNHQLTVEEKEMLSSTIDSQETMVASRGTIELNVECRKSEGSDQTVIDSNSSERTLPDHLEASFGGDDVHIPMYRQPSLSKALEEWIIPFHELSIEEVIGTGHVGTVYKGQWHGPVAIKKIPINPAVDRNAQILAFKQEIATLKKTRHENVVLFMGACMEPLAIVTSFVNGDTLYKETRAMPRWHLAKVTNVASQIAQGMAYLHSKDIIHKHLTSKNVFVERGEKVVIADFGLQNVARLASSHPSRKNIMKIPEGWLNYLSPEVIKALRIADPTEYTVKLPFSKQSDIFAFGTIWYELLCGDWPHSSSIAPEIVIWRVGRGLKPSLHSMTNSTKEAKDIVMKCWMHSTQDRPSFSMLSTMLERLPKKRLTRSPSYPIQLSRSIDSFFKLMD